MQQQLASLQEDLAKARTYRDEQEGRISQFSKEEEEIQQAQSAAARQDKTVLASEQLAAIKKTQSLTPVPPKGPKTGRK